MNFSQRDRLHINLHWEKLHKVYLQYDNVHFPNIRTNVLDAPHFMNGQIPVILILGKYSLLIMCACLDCDLNGQIETELLNILKIMCLPTGTVKINTFIAAQSKHHFADSPPVRCNWTYVSSDWITTQQLCHGSCYKSILTFFNAVTSDNKRMHTITLSIVLVESICW